MKKNLLTIPAVLLQTTLHAQLNGQARTDVRNKKR